MKGASTWEQSAEIEAFGSQAQASGNMTSQRPRHPALIVGPRYTAPLQDISVGYMKRALNG